MVEQKPRSLPGSPGQFWLRAESRGNGSPGSPRRCIRSPNFFAPEHNQAQENVSWSKGVCAGNAASSAVVPEPPCVIVSIEP